MTRRLDPIQTLCYEALMGDDEEWLEKWLDGVAGGASTMSQRKLSAVEAHGGLSHAKKVAQAKRVHLLVVEDDRGEALVAASVKPFKVVC